MWLFIWNIVKSPKNAGLIALGAAVIGLCIFSTGLYVAVGVKDARLARIEAQLKTKDATIDALFSENKAMAETVSRIRVQLEKEQAVRSQARKIRAEIKEDMTDEEAAAVHRHIADLFNGVRP